MPELARLNTKERGAAALLGVLLAAAAFAVLYCPPEIKVLADTSCCGQQPQEVAADTELLTIVLAVLSALAFLIGLLGVRFTKIKAGKDGVELAIVTEFARPEGKALAASPVKRPAPGDSLRRWYELPPWARIALEQWSQGAPDIANHVRFLLVDVRRQEKKWSRRWRVDVWRSSTYVQVLELTQGRGSSRVSEEDLSHWE